MPDDNSWITGSIKELLKLLPLKKIDKYQATNLAFDVAAMGLTVRYTVSYKNELLSMVTWLVVIIMCFFCVVWVSRQ